MLSVGQGGGKDPALQVVAVAVQSDRDLIGRAHDQAGRAGEHDRGQLESAVSRDEAPEGLRVADAGFDLVCCNSALEYVEPERLAAVHQHAMEAKELANAIGAKAMTDYTQFIPSTLTAQAARLASRWGLMNRMSPIYNCVITNVPGPQVPLYNTGARMVANYGTGPILDGMGLFHAITSYCGDFAISATSCRVIMPDMAKSPQ